MNTKRTIQLSPLDWREMLRAESMQREKPEGWFTTYDAANESGESCAKAAHKLRRLHAAGRLDRNYIIQNGAKTAIYRFKPCAVASK